MQFNLKLASITLSLAVMAAISSARPVYVATTDLTTAQVGHVRKDHDFEAQLADPGELRASPSYNEDCDCGDPWQTSSVAQPRPSSTWQPVVSSSSVSAWQPQPSTGCEESQTPSSSPPAPSSVSWQPGSSGSSGGVGANPGTSGGGTPSGGTSASSPPGLLQIVGSGANNLLTGLGDGLSGGGGSATTPVGGGATGSSSSSPGGLLQSVGEGADNLLTGIGYGLGGHDV